MSNQTAEDTLLNAILTCDYRTGVEEASTIVTAEDFVQDWNRRLWRAMLAVREKGLPVDLTILHDELVEAGMKPDDATQLLAGAMDGAPCKGYVSLYATRVKAAGRDQRIAKTVELANSRLVDGEQPEWVAGEMLDQLNHIERVEAKDRALIEVAPGALQALADRLNGDESKQGLPTGLYPLDQLTTGINPDELWIAGGMPGRGKTAFGLQTALHLVGRGTPVYLVSLEMSAAAILRRLLKMKFGATVMEVPGKRWGEVVAYAEDLRSLPLVINDSSSLDAGEIARRARLAIERCGSRLVIVDYLQLIRPAPGTRDRREAVGEATNVLRQLAKDTHVPVLLLSQLRRPSSLNDRPTMIDLKESGDIEAHAHVVLLFYFIVGADGRFTGEEEIVIGKQREGPTGSIPVYFEGSRGVFHQRDTQ
jgi:replicative DNA helicase